MLYPIRTSFSFHIIEQTPVCKVFPFWLLAYLKKQKNDVTHQVFIFVRQSRFATWSEPDAYPFRLAGSEWYTCFPCSAIVGAWCAAAWLWLAFSGWEWLLRSTWLVGRDMWCGSVMFPLMSSFLSSGLSGLGSLRFFVGDDTSMTLMPGTLACLRASSLWASCSFFMWLIATAVLMACCEANTEKISFTLTPWEHLNTDVLDPWFSKCGTCATSGTQALPSGNWRKVLNLFGK